MNYTISFPVDLAFLAENVSMCDFRRQCQWAECTTNGKPPQTRLLSATNSAELCHGIQHASDSKITALSMNLLKHGHQFLHKVDVRKQIVPDGHLWPWKACVQ